MPTIIDSFLVTLGLDNRKFKEGAQGAVEGMNKLAENATKIFAIFAGGMELKGFIESMMKVEISTMRLANNLGMDIEKLQAWQGAATLSDGSTEGFNLSLKAISGSLIDIEKNLPGSARALTLFQAAGIKSLALGKKSDALEVFDQLAEKMFKMSSMEASRLGERLGLDAGTISLLRKGKEGVTELLEEARKLGVYTLEDAKAAEKLDDELTKLKLSGAQTGRQIMTLLMPALQFAAEKILQISQWAGKHGTEVKAAFIGIAVAAAVAAISVAAAAWEFTLLAAAIAAVVGGVSWLVMKYKEWDAAGNETTTKLGKFFAAVKEIWTNIKDVVQTVFDKIWELIKDYVDVWIAEFQLLFALMSGDPDKIQDAFVKLLEAVGKLVKHMAWMAIYEFTVMCITIGTAMDNLEKHLSAKWDGLTKKFSFLKVLPYLNPVTAVFAGANDIRKGIANFRGGDEASQTTGYIGAMAAQRKQVFGAYNQTQSSSQSTEFHIGSIQIQTQATDSQGIATDIYGSLVAQADGGLR